MSDSFFQTSVDQDLPPDWRTTTPGLELRPLATVALAVPLLLAAGVYWLHKLPIGPNLRANDSRVIEVRVIGQQASAVEGRDSPSPAQRSVQAPAETLVPDPVHAIPMTEIASAPPEQAAAPASVAPSSAPPVARIAINKEKAAAFRRAMESHIARFKRYPDWARRERAQGIVRLLFSMQRDGSVTGVQIVSSSGYTSLDAAAIETIRSAQPMPRIPSELPQQLSIEMPIAFDLPQ
jgi:protein TonB